MFRKILQKLEEMHGYVYNLVVHLKELGNYRLFILAKFKYKDFERKYFCKNWNCSFFFRGTEID